MQYNISPKAAIVDSNEEALRNMFVSMTFMKMLVRDLLERSNSLDPAREQALSLIDQSLESVNAYLERTGVWNLKD
jgi:hypothetical protein